jgi:hypothetical protein
MLTYAIVRTEIVGWFTNLVVCFNIMSLRVSEITFQPCSKQEFTHSLNRQEPTKSIEENSNLSLLKLRIIRARVSISTIDIHIMALIKYKY